jgi:hypothetical protein
MGVPVANDALFLGCHVFHAAGDVAVFGADAAVGELYDGEAVLGRGGDYAPNFFGGAGCCQLGDFFVNAIGVF